MKVVMTFEFDELQRQQITDYCRKRFGSKSLPRYASRAMLRDFIHEAIDNQWTGLTDTLMLDKEED